MSLYDSLLTKLEGRPYSNYFSTYCIFDTHQTPALLVYEDGFVCLSCHKKGTLEYLDKMVGSHFRLTQRQALKPQLLPRWRRWEEKYGTIENIAKAAHASVLKFPSYQSYFKQRKIFEFIDQGYFGYLDGWYTFPVYSPEHHIVDIVVRAGKHKGNSRYVLRPSDERTAPVLYCPNYQRVQESEVVYVVYGIVDSWAIEALGLPCITGTTGKSLSADQLKPLGKKFIIVPDDGEEREAYLLANKLGWRAEVKKLKYDDCHSSTSSSSPKGATSSSSKGSTSLRYPSLITPRA